MSYTLLYSRAISSDSVLRILDVPIPDKSVMIEVLSLISPYRRLFGYVYALRSDGITDYERSGGYLLPFGKNRINFAAATAPYFLELFPRRGITSGIISVYTGEPSPPTPPPAAWRSEPGSDREFKLFASPAGIQTREIATQGSQFEAAEGAIEGHIYQNYLYWKMSDSTMFRREIGIWNPAFLVSLESYESVRSDVNSIVL